MKARLQNQDQNNNTGKKVDRKKLLPKAKELKMTGPLKKVVGGGQGGTVTQTFVCSQHATC